MAKWPNFGHFDVFDDFFHFEIFLLKNFKKLHTFTVARRAYQILDGVNFDTLLDLWSKRVKSCQKVTPEG